MPQEAHEKKWFEYAEMGDIAHMREQRSSMRSAKLRIPIDLKDLGDRTAMVMLKLEPKTPSQLKLNPGLPLSRS